MKDGRSDRLSLRIGALILSLVFASCSAQRKEMEEESKDFTPPGILNVQRIQIQVGEEPDYHGEVRAYDIRDGDVPVEIDASAVNPDVPGYYTVVYRAQDKAGNIAERTATVEVTEYAVEGWNGTAADPAEVRALIEETCAELFPDGFDGLTELERARVIYDWITQNIRYRSDPDVLSVMYDDRFAEAVKAALAERCGNCYSYYAVSAALLSRAGFEVKRAWTVEPAAMPGQVRYHYWNLVLLNGVWMHFDTTPNFDGTILNLFMLTEEEVAAKHAQDWTYSVEEEDFDNLFDE